MVTMDPTPQTDAGNRRGRGRARRRLVVAIVAMATVAAGIAGAGTAMADAEPTQSAHPTRSFEVTGGGGAAYGKFIWYNRSVQVGGKVTGFDDPGLGEYSCVAVVFTAYDGSGKQVAREARPGDKQDTCSRAGVGYGFMLDASTVEGGIRRIRVDLWGHTETGSFGPVTKNYYRPS